MMRISNGGTIDIVLAIIGIANLTLSATATVLILQGTVHPIIFVQVICSLLVGALLLSEALSDA